MSAITYETAIKVVHAIDLLSQGRTVTKACEEAGVSVSTLHRYRNEDKDIGIMYDAAVTEGYERQADALIDLDNLAKMTSAREDKELRIASDNMKWLLSRRARDKYGERVTVDHNHVIDKNVVEHIANGAQRALERMLGGTPSIEHKPVVEDANFTVIETDPLAAFR